MDKKRVIFFIAGLVILFVVVYFTFFYYHSCKDLSCFKCNQIKCSKTKFISDEESTTWKYFIKGKQNNFCVIEVTVLQVKQGTLDRKILEGKSMDCYLEIGSIASPESDLTVCHGRLKEDIQEIMIKNTHSQILSNLENSLKGLI